MSKREDRIIRTNLARHAKWMEAFIAHGLSREEASKAAFDMVTKGEATVKGTAARAALAKVGK